MKKKQYIIYFALIYFFIFCINAISSETVIGQMEFDKPQFVALIQNKKTSNIYVYKEQEIIFPSENKSKYFKILGIEDKFIVGMNNNDNIFAVGKKKLLPNSKEFIFLKSVRVERIRFSYTYGDYNDPDFKFSRLDGDTIYLSRKYKSMTKSNILSRNMLKNIEVEKKSENEFILNRENIEPVLIIAENILKSLIKKQEEKKQEEGKQKKRHDTLNLKLSNSAAEIVLGSSGILVKRFFLKKIPGRIDLQEGDFIKRINKKPINGLRDVYNALMEVKESKNATTIEVDLIRNYKILTKHYQIR